jgi:membrane associated rhomboid family serine protease
MRSRYPSSTSNFSYQFGPGPLTPAIKVLIAVNVAAFVVTFFAPQLTLQFGLRPADVFERFALWQPFTYMFLHAGPMHLLFNMLTLWMMGVELERTWGTRFFVKFYFVSGLGAGLTQMLLGILPVGFAGQFYYPSTVGASGAIFGLLLAYAIYFPNRPILMYFLFPVPARYFVMILGGLSLLSAFGGGSGVAHTAHLGGLVTAYLYLKGSRMHLISEIQYRWVKWRINRHRRRFDVYSGGRADDINRRVH